MKRSDFWIPYKQITERLAPRVRGRVVHMTCARNLPGIFQAEGVCGNADGRFASSFGSSSSGYFRKRGAVSVFDYRLVSDDDFESAWRKCGPYTALSKCDYDLALLFLTPSSFPQLMSWRRWKEDQAWEEMLVPHVEAGFTAPLPLDMIEEIVKVHTQYEPSEFDRALARFQEG